MTTPRLLTPEDPAGLVYHLSHTDLDGYGAQFMLKAAGVNTVCFNADYRDIPLAMDVIVEQILERGQPANLLLTDLNLTLDQADQIDKRIKKLKVPTQVQLLDHHATGAEVAAKYPWYHLDTERCATKLAFESVADRFDETRRAQYALRADFVDIGDRWLKDEPLFRKALYLLGLVMQDDHLAPPLSEMKREYRFHLIEEFFARHERGENLESIERALYDLRKAFLQGRIDDAERDNPDIPLNDKFHILSARLLDETTVPMLTIDGVRTGIFYSWPHEVWRGVIMDMMETRKIMDMAISVRGNGKLSLRANPGVDAGAISAKYFKGGGHPGAAGGELRENRLRDLNQAVSIIEQTINPNPKPTVATAKLGDLFNLKSATQAKSDSAKK
ncbi:DHHA1 domain-containing protein [Halothiobacillus sp. DCM-1]|uniref:DHHA1 domain-containing protein n=1 Tax=Halothiobacillus sp. DCM-1 TaxID=3112558 RepID=UPI00324F0567